VTALVGVAMAQSPSPQALLSDSRISVNTLLREDIFAGFLADDMDRFSRGEKNLDLLLEQRPAEKSTLLAWRALTKLYRAIRATENNRNDEFQQYYRQATDLFAEAARVGPDNPGVSAIRGGSYVVLGDRLPKEYRPAAWSQAYESYRALWKLQAPAVDRLPVHLRGELLAGLAQSAQRTGHAEEMSQYVDKILEVLRDTPYEPIAKRWKANPASAANSTIACMTCHDAGRLAARVASLNGK
jgi:hypothetical protein